jgi:hypothetical protein
MDPGPDASIRDMHHQPPLTIHAAIGRLLFDSRTTLLHQWNWKSALFSSLFRALIFFLGTFRSGAHSAWAATLTEFAFRAATAGFYGSITQTFCHVTPQWQALAATVLVLPAMMHLAEFAVHWTRGTPRLGLNMALSVGFTVLSTAFNLFAMKRGALLVGRGERPLHQDMAAMPRLIRDFVLAAPRTALRALR